MACEPCCGLEPSKRRVSARPSASSRQRRNDAASHASWNQHLNRATGMSLSIPIGYRSILKADDRCGLERRIDAVCPGAERRWNLWCRMADWSAQRPARPGVDLTVPDLGPLGPLDDEIEELRSSGSRVELVLPDANSLAAIF